MESIYDSLNNIVGTIREDVTSKGGHEGPAVNVNIRLSSCATPTAILLSGP